MKPSAMPPMTMLLSLFALVCIAVVGSSCATGRDNLTSQSKPATAVKWRETFRTTESHSLRVDGLAERGLGVTEQRGLAFFDHHEVAALGMWFTSETMRTNITYRGYAQYTFQDGSTIFALLEGTGVVPGEQKGTLTFLRGSGRFVGINGKAGFTAVTVTPDSAGSDSYADAVGEYVLLQSIIPPTF